RRDGIPPHAAVLGGLRNSNSMNDLKDKVILITGAGKGSGRLLAKAFAEREAIVAANDISPINVEETVEHINAKGGRSKAYIEDVAKKVAAQYLVKQVEDDFGHIDILVNHAAVEPHIPLLDMDEWDWHRIMDVNLTGAFLMIQSVGRVMREQGSGVIINLITRPDSEVNEAAFVASMNGLEGLTRAAARELNPYGIHVYTVENRGDKIVASVFALLQTKNL
ncbi:MAG TPA: SDR family NAD(P)-dependent oxidoreductase, partial [Anaerolineales bacterium]|nr:SDR family NAD(P)-dependent oxidoreductase [Anaerolineales bacterium]